MVVILLTMSRFLSASPHLEAGDDQQGIIRDSLVFLRDTINSPAMVLICKLNFVIFAEAVHEDDECAHARGVGDQGFLPEGERVSSALEIPVTG